MEENQFGMQRKEADIKKRQNRRAAMSITVVVAVLLLIICVTAVYFTYIQKQLFHERSSHLTEITIKVADQIDTITETGMEKTKMASAYLLKEDIANKETLLGVLKEMSQKALEQDKNNVLMVFDNDSNYYTDTQKSGKWNNKIAVDGEWETVSGITTLPYDTINTYLIMVEKLPEPYTIGNTGITLTHIALAVNMENVQEMLNVSGFGENCMTYIVTKDNRRVYQHTFGKQFIETPDIMNTLRECEFVQGGNAADLQEAIYRESVSGMEFVYRDGTDYFVSTAGLVRNTLLLFVPTDVLSVNVSAYLSITVGYFVAIALIIMVLFAYIFSGAVKTRSDRQIIRQQKEANRKLEAYNDMLKTAKEEAEHANRAKSDFLSNMSHDIRTPMNAIIGFTVIANTNIDNKEKVLDCLDKIASSSNHLLSLINDILDMSKIESGKIQMNEQKCSLSVVMNNLINMIQPQVSEKDLEFFSETDNVEHENVIIDSLRLNQVLINIVGNAVKYTEPGGSVTLLLEELPSDDHSTGNYRISVKDTGIGMSKDYLPHVFDAFTRERSSTVSRIQGTGLGLAITKRIIELMGGTISVQSEPGKGSEFIIQLPIKLADDDMILEQDESEEELSEEKEWNFEGMHFLVAEDVDLNAEIIVEIFREFGISADIASNGRMAVDMLKASGPGYYDAVLMDVQMPVLDGYAATKEIRGLEEPEYSNIPIIAMTANAFEEDKAQALGAGMNAHIAKPVDIPVLMKTLEGLKKHRKDGDMENI